MLGLVYNPLASLKRLADRARIRDVTENAGKNPGGRRLTEFCLSQTISIIIRRTGARFLTGN